MSIIAVGEVWLIVTLGWGGQESGVKGGVARRGCRPISLDTLSFHPPQLSEAFAQKLKTFMVRCSPRSELLCKN